MPVFDKVLEPRNSVAVPRDAKIYGSYCCSLPKQAVRSSVPLSSGEPAHVAKYAFQLAQSFNNFYHEHSVIAEENAERRALLLWLTTFVRQQLLQTLAVLGIEQPPYM